MALKDVSMERADRIVDGACYGILTVFLAVALGCVFVSKLTFYVFPAAPYIVGAVSAAVIALKTKKYLGAYFRHRVLQAAFATIVFFVSNSLTRRLALLISQYFIATTGDLETTIHPILGTAIIFGTDVLGIFIFCVCMYFPHPTGMNGEKDNRSSVLIEWVLVAIGSVSMWYLGIIPELVSHSSAFMTMFFHFSNAPL